MAIDIMAAFENEPQPQDFVLPGFLAGTVGALVAPGATGKSFLALQLAATIACDVAGGNTLGLDIKHSGNVTYFNGEDPVPEITRRVHALGSHLDESARDAVAQRLTIEPVSGSMLDIMNERHRERIIEYCADARLIIFDTLSRIHTLDENDNGAMSHVISTLEHIAKRTGASVMFLHHVSKATALSGLADLQQASRGASALIDNARWCGYVARMTEKEAEKLSDRIDRKPIDKDQAGRYVRFGLSKQNYGELQLAKWLERTKGGILKPCYLKDAKNGGGNARQEA
jgi:hypothetical protein